jgi:DNA replication protein DnaC
MNSSARDAELSEFCKALKLPDILREYEALCRRAKESGLEYEEFLYQLLEIEVRNRQDSAAKQRFKDAHFPDQKTLSQIDW